jgi:hypothetical protein
MKRMMFVIVFLAVPFFLMAGPSYEETQKIPKDEFVSLFTEYLTRYPLVTCFEETGYNHIDTGVIIYGSYFYSSGPNLYIYGKKGSMWISFSNSMSNSSSYSTKSQEGRTDFKRRLIQNLNSVKSKNGLSIDIQTLIPRGL